MQAAPGGRAAGISRYGCHDASTSNGHFRIESRSVTGGQLAMFRHLLRKEEREMVGIG